MEEEGGRTEEELVEAIQNLVESHLGLDYKLLVSTYLTDPTQLEYRGGQPLTEADLIADILDDGKMLVEEGASFDDIVIAGASAVAFALGLIE